MSIPGMFTPPGSGGPPNRGQNAGVSGAAAAVNTMSDPLALSQGTSGIAPLTRFLATIGVLGAIAGVFWRLSIGLPPTVELLEACAPGDVACVVDPAVRAAVLDPLLLAAGMFALAAGAFSDAARRPATGFVLALGSVALGLALVVTR